MRSTILTYVVFMIASSAHAQNEALVVEAESAVSGADFSVLEDGGNTYVTPSTNFAATTHPGNDSKVITFFLQFEEAGEYDLYVKMRVGTNGFDDDSFYMARGFGIKSSGTDSDWQVVNNLVPVGHAGPEEIVTGAGSTGNMTWKWLNISEFIGGSDPFTFVVGSTATEYVFQLGAREDGLDLDKIAFGKSDYYYTVDNLENGQAGTDTLPGGNTEYPEDSDQLVRTYINPVLPGDHPDLTLFKDGSDFYVCNSSFHFTPYLAILHSTDLVHWEEVSRVIPPDWAGLNSSAPKAGIWQGAITYFYDSYWIYYSNNAGGGQYFSKASSPSGPWSSPVRMNTTNDTGASGYDNSVFVDDDGTPYLLIKPGRNVNRIQEIGPDGHLTGAVMNLDWVNANNQYSWAEGPVMCKKDGWYYYFIAGNVGGGQYVLRSQTLTADENSWEALGDFFEPISDPATAFRGPNHMTQPFELEDGSWWTLSHSYENLPGDNWGGKGRQGLLHRVTWDESGKPTGSAPTTSPLLMPDLPKSGIPWKLPRSDYFEQETPDLSWYFLGPDAALNYSLAEQPGWLRMDPGSGRSHILQKDAGHYYSLVTRVSIDATEENHEAGLYLTNGNESVNVRLFSGFQEGKQVVFAFGNTVYQVANSVGAMIWLKLERAEHSLSGFYSANGVSWHQIGETIDAGSLDQNQQNDNWWVGNSQGLYAQGITADFDLFFYRDGASPLPVAGFENAFGIDVLSKSVGRVVTSNRAQGGWLMLGGVELGGERWTSTAVEINASAPVGGSLEVWLDDIEREGTLIATIPVTSTGGDEAWEAFSVDIPETTGQHDVYLRFQGAAEGLFINTIRFVPELIPLGMKKMGKNDWLRVYPNPFSEGLEVVIDQTPAEYVIYDVTGRKVEGGILKAPKSVVGHHLTCGVYHLEVKTTSGCEVVRILRKGG